MEEIRKRGENGGEAMPRRIALFLVAVLVLMVPAASAFASAEEGGGPPGIAHSQGPTANALPGLLNALGNQTSAEKVNQSEIVITKLVDKATPIIP